MVLLSTGARRRRPALACAWQAFGDQRLVNTFLTNVHGPDQPTQLLGAPISEIIAISAVAG